MTDGARLGSTDVRRFILAGHALFTIRNAQTGGRFTYRVKASEPNDKHPQQAWFVSVLNGSDNLRDYAYLGMISESGSYFRTAKSRFTDDATCHKAFAWFWARIDTLPEWIEVWHHGMCGRCGRLLTVPESIARGLGPECAGVEPPDNPATRKRPARAAVPAAAPAPTEADPPAAQAPQAAFQAPELPPTPTPEPAFPAPEGRAYLPYQIEGIRYLLDHPRTLLADEPGLGKTIQVLGAYNAAPAIRSMLVVCPATLRLNWRDEAQRWLTRPATVYVVDDKHPTPPEGSEIVIVNYDRLKGPCLAALLARTWDALVLDEAHYVKERTARRTKACLGYWDKAKKAVVPGLAQRAARLWVLTGTPIPNRVEEIHNVLAALAPREYGYWQRFVERYCDGHKEKVARGKVVWITSGASNLDELRTRLRATVMFRRLKADVLRDLPAKRRQVVVLPPNGAAGVLAAEADAAAEHLARIERLEAVAAAAQAAGDDTAYERAAAALRHGYTVAFEECSAVRHEVALAKAPAVVEHVTDLLEGGTAKVVVFAHHRDVEDLLVAGLAAYSPVMLRGGDDAEAKRAAIARFQADPECRVFVGAITAAGTGITLTAASTVVFAELDWVPGTVSQAEDRCHRIGQHDSVLVQHLVFDGSMDAKIVQTLTAKQAVACAALDRPVAGVGEAVDDEERRIARCDSRAATAYEDAAYGRD